MGSFRLLLAIAVVVAHSAPLFGLQLTGGAVAVQAFYIVSGFYVSLILNEKYEPGAAGTRLFYSNRFLRIYPIYWTVLLASIALSFVERWQPGIHTTGTLDNLIRDFPGLSLGGKLYILVTNVSLVGMDWGNFLRFDGGHIQATVNAFQHRPRAYEMDFVPQAWTLGVEVVVYLIAPFLFRRSVPVLAAIVALTTAARAYAFHLGLTEDPWTYRFFQFELGLFVLGSIAYRVYKADTILNQRYAGWICLAAVLGLTFYFPHLSAAPSVIPGFQAGQLLYLLAVFIGIPAIFQLTKTNKTDRWIGELSYPVYLSQMMIIPLCSGQFGPGNVYPVIGTVAVSALIVLLIDRPLEKFRQSRVQRVKGAQWSAPA
ncbi:acyltransferase family protein [Cupriavidus plantarum]|uniref:acyltransferase family protein n=1 Tax=Cupriavidus plantarum TaxID=942865 RepID=UPI00339D4668